MGRIEPITEEPGVRARLRNLGYLRDTEADPELYKGALLRFQRRYSLDLTGEADDATRAKLLEAHIT